MFLFVFFLLDLWCTQTLRSHCVLAVAFVLLEKKHNFLYYGVLGKLSSPLIHFKLYAMPHEEYSHFHCSYVTVKNEAEVSNEL